MTLTVLAFEILGNQSIWAREKLELPPQRIVSLVRPKGMVRALPRLNLLSACSRVAASSPRSRGPSPSCERFVSV